MTQVWADLNLLLMRTKEKGSLGGPAVWEIPTTSFQFVVKEGNGNPLQCSCLENPRDGGSLVGCRIWGHTELDTTESA